MWDLLKQNNNILPALYLSYHYLPSYLKRCFVYCSVFPKNYEIDKDNLIKLWMAEDLLEPQNNKRIEKVGEEYFDDLLSRSLFQKSTDQRFETVCYTMHDLVHDLATFIAGDFRLSLNDNNSDELLTKVRHLSHLKGQIHGFEKYGDLFNAKCLRTFFFPSTCYGKIQLQLENLEARKLWSKLTCLRSLSFHGCTYIKKLSDSIGNLKLLKYLNLSETEISEVPNTVCSLYNLQTLILSGCRKLKLLPTQMGRLINLRHLDITSTGVERMAFKMGNLKNLQTLTDFVVGKCYGSTIRLLKDLQHLHGKLCFRGLENVVRVEDVLEANLKEKKYLTEIEFWWSSDGCCNNSRIMYKKVLNGLELNRSLTDLIISWYGGEQFPEWLGHPSFRNLEKIRLQGCRECRMLPPLGQLPFLKDLTISGFDELVKVGKEFYRGGCSVPTWPPFRCLKSLHIEDMKKCEEWSFNIEGNGNATFPELATFALRNCPRLTAHICFPITIEKVVIEGCKKLELLRNQQQYSYRNFGELSIQNCEFIDRVALDYTMFTRISVTNCGNLNSLSYSQQQQQPPATFSLKRFHIKDCPKLESFPEGGLFAPNLEELQIYNCENLRSLPEHMQTLLPSLQTLSLSKCPELELLQECPMPSNLRQLEIYKCDKLLASRRHWNLQTLTSLSIRYIDGVALDTFPEEGLLPTTLVYLTIGSLPRLKSLNGMALRHLSSLKKLEIFDFKELQCLPQEGLPASLSKLYIYDCPLLKQRCQRDSGEDWPKIAHIPLIKIDWKVIF